MRFHIIPSGAWTTSASSNGIGEWWGEVGLNINLQKMQKNSLFHKVILGGQDMAKLIDTQTLLKRRYFKCLHTTARRLCAVPGNPARNEQE